MTARSTGRGGCLYLDESVPEIEGVCEIAIGSLEGPKLNRIRSRDLGPIYRLVFEKFTKHEGSAVVYVHEVIALVERKPLNPRRRFVDTVGTLAVIRVGNLICTLPVIVSCGG